MKNVVFTFLMALGLQVGYYQSLTAFDVVSSKENMITDSMTAPITVSNFNLNRQGSSIIARAGEKIFTTLNFSCDSSFSDPHSLYQIVVGYEDIGPQKCIFNEMGYRFEGKEGILSFFCEAPQEPGIYEVQCNISSARSSAEALQSWWDQKGMDNVSKVSVGRIIVK